jgi:hypothetical protein
VNGPHWVRRMLAGVTVEEVQRFDATFDLAATELDARRSVGDESWHCLARAEVDNAIRHRANYKLEAAWTALKAVQRERVRTFEPSELVAEARIVRNESDEKLSGWRRTSVRDLLPSELLDRVVLVNGGLTVERTVRTLNPVNAGGASTPGATDGASERNDDAHDRSAEPSASAPGVGDVSWLVDDLRTRLIAAKHMLDAHSDNVHHKFRILRRAVISTSVAIAVVLAVLVGLVAMDWVPSALVTEDSPLGSWRLLLVVMTLGMLGAFLSSATELRNRVDKLTVPDLRVNYTLMGMRPVVGAMGATVVIVVVQSALGDAVNLESTAILGLAIVAGFTERLATRTVTAAADAVGK